MTEPDMFLPGAVEALDDAIHALTGARYQTIELETPEGSARTTRVVFRDSIYQEILESIGGAQGTQLGATARSMPPLWVDAADWLREVDSQAAEWWPNLVWDNPDAPAPETVRRLRSIVDASWRPQDTPFLEDVTDKARAWAKKGEALLDGDQQHRWELAAPCPACGTKTVYREDSAGETVRQSALQVTQFGCACENCKTVWSPEYYRHLAKVIGCDLPEGVLE